MSKKLSKQLSYYLRHKPDKIGLTMDSEGWVYVSEILDKLNISREELDHVVETNNKKRFLIKDGKIRASQGHTCIKINFKEATPPYTLYHGTSKDRYGKIARSGYLSKMKRHHVHLSSEIETAKNVGSRCGGELVILKINTVEMKKDGYKFYISDNGVWLCDDIHVRYITT